MRKPSDRWIAVGGVLTTVGGAAAVAYWIYGMQATPEKSFWHLPGVVALAVTVLGAVFMTIGWFAPSSPEVRQHQQGGKQSKNYQAGGDINVRRNDEERPNP